MTEPQYTKASRVRKSSLEGSQVTDIEAGNTLRRLRWTLPILVIALSVTSMVIGLNEPINSAFGSWLFFAAFVTAFFQCIYWIICVAVIKRVSREGTSLYLGAFRGSLLPASAWCLYLIFRATEAYPSLANATQIMAFVFLCLSFVFMIAWWQLSREYIKVLQQQVRRSLSKA